MIALEAGEHQSLARRRISSGTRVNLDAKTRRTSGVPTFNRRLIDLD